jgi:hypothetical protein
VIKIDRLQVVIYLEEAALNVSVCLELVEKSKKGDSQAHLLHFRFDMGELTRVKLEYIARIRYDFKSLKALNTIRHIWNLAKFVIALVG